MIKTRQIRVGKCPFCDTDQYERQDLNPDGDMIFIKCECLKCKKNFSEKFSLIGQGWDDE